jgi:hypothetical protein
MELEEIKNIINDYKNKPNKSLVTAMDLLIKLTHHLDTTEKEYNKIYDEYKKRLNE